MSRDPYSLRGLDEWLTRDRSDDTCDFCGCHQSERLDGYQPKHCTGECGERWRDPDAEREMRREEGK
jgi:hypothetical protein